MKKSDEAYKTIGEVAKELDLYRVSRQTSGDSNEWYAISYSKIWKQIEIAEQEINSAKA